MNGIEIIILIGTIVLLAVGIGYYMNKGQASLKEMKEDYQNNEEVQEIVQLAKELYNKDLRPVVAKKAPKKEKVEEVIPEGIVEEPIKEKTKSEFPIDKSKKKRKYYPKKK
jgi:hypothetical protein